MPRKVLFFWLSAIAFANATFGPTVTAFEADGPNALMSGAGVGYAVWIVGGWCLYRIFVMKDREAADRGDYAIAGAAAAFIVFPSAMVAWIVLAFLATWGAFRASARSGLRTPYLILIAVALRVPTTTLLLGTLSEEVLSIDAIFVRATLALTHIETELIGNIIVNADGHRLGVMTGCSSFTNVSMGLLVWFAITRGTEHAVSPRALKAGAAIALSIVALNVGRLTLMAIDPDLYHFIHDDIGKDIFEFSLIVATLSLTFLGLGDTHETDRIPVAGAHTRV